MNKSNQIIYKYRDWSDKRHQETLRDNTLFLASPNSFNDPFDCKLPDNILHLDSIEKKEKYVANFVKNAKTIGKEDEIKDAVEKLRENLNTDLLGFHERLELAKNDRANTMYGVISFSKIWNSSLMWSYYSNYHKGFAIGYDLAKIKNLEIYTILGDVNYNNLYDYPSIDPLTDEWSRAIQRIFNKAYDWKHEQEYRLIKNFSPNPPTLEDRKVIIPDNCIHEIILGMKIQKDHEEEILTIARKKSIRVYKIKKIPMKFLIDRERII